MIAVTLTTPRLRLDQLQAGDLDRVVEYCRDPLFETTMNTPWPYEPEHADFFIGEHAPRGWRENTEYTWAIRERDDGLLLGAIGYRQASRDLGYWLGAPHRGHGFMTEAAGAVVDWLFALGHQELFWECVPGNLASAGVARKLGFTYTGTGPSLLASRDDTVATSWHARLAHDDDRGITPGWPA